MNPGNVSTSEHIRATLSFAGLYQITHELLKTVVLDGVREFYGADEPAHANPYGRPRYQAEVLSLDEPLVGPAVRHFDHSRPVGDAELVQTVVGRDHHRVVAAEAEQRLRDRLLEGPIRHTGEFEVQIHLHADVHTAVKVNVVADE